MGLQTMEEYIRRRQNTVAQYIATKSLLDLCEGSERAPGERLGIQWRDKAGINLAGERESATAIVTAVVTEVATEERDRGEE